MNMNPYGGTGNHVNGDNGGYGDGNDGDKDNTNGNCFFNNDDKNTLLRQIEVDRGHMGNHINGYDDRNNVVNIYAKNTLMTEATLDHYSYNHISCGFGGGSSNCLVNDGAENTLLTQPLADHGHYSGNDINGNYSGNDINGDYTDFDGICSTNFGFGYGTNGNSLVNNGAENISLAQTQAAFDHYSGNDIYNGYDDFSGDDGGGTNENCLVNNGALLTHTQETLGHYSGNDINGGYSNFDGGSDPNENCLVNNGVENPFLAQTQTQITEMIDFGHYSDNDIYIDFSSGDDTNGNDLVNNNAELTQTQTQITIGHCLGNDINGDFGDGGGTNENDDGGGTNENGLLNNGVENTPSPQTQPIPVNSSALSVDWMPEEDSNLKDILVRYASSRNIVYCYTNIAKELKTRDTREVAARCVWLYEIEKNKRGIDNHSPMMSQGNENDTESDSRAQDDQTIEPMTCFDKAINSATRHLIKRIDQGLSQAFAFIKTSEDDTNLLIQTHEIMTSIINSMNNTLPKKVKEERSL